MAKGKRQNLSAEELLEQALVPEDEQPYKVPKNWIWIYGKYMFSPMESQRPTGEYFQYIDIESIDNKNQRVLEPKTIAVSEAPSRASRKLYTGATLFSLVRPYLRNIAYIDESLSDCIASTGFYVCQPRKGFNYRYLFYLMTSDYVVNGLNAFMKGDNSPSIRNVDIEKFAYPLPPITEQERIVERIENLFVKLDQAKELAQNALDSFEKRKVAILHKAFKGELTTKWREEHNVSIDSWIESTLSSVCKSIVDGDHMPPPKSESGVPFLVISNINKGVLNFDNTRFVPREYYDKLSESRKPQLGDVLYSVVGSYGIPVVVDDERDFCFQRHMALLKPSNIETRFLWYLLQTNMIFQKVTEIATGTAQLTVPIKGLRKISFYIPSLPEQQEIIRILDNLFEKERRAKELADAIERIDLLKKAILARAFRGELGTNDSTDESAKDILEELLINSTKEAEVPKRAKSIKIDPSIERELKTNIERQIYLLLLREGQASITNLLFASDNYFEITQALNRLVKTGLIYEKNGVYLCRKG